MKPKISILTLGVANFQKSYDFYAKGLGFETHNYKQGDNYAMFKLEGTWLAIFPKELLEKDAGIPFASIGEGRLPFTIAHNVGSIDKVDELYSHALSVGAKSAKSPQKAEWGGYSAYFTDPDGYLWEVAYNPFTDLT